MPCRTKLLISQGELSLPGNHFPIFHYSFSNVRLPPYEWISSCGGEQVAPTVQNLLKVCFRTVGVGKEGLTEGEEDPCLAVAVGIWAVLEGPGNRGVAGIDPDR